MNYNVARPTIRSGDLLAFSSGSWRSWSDIKVNMVRIFTRSTYSHVGIAWVVSGRVFILEAVTPKLRIFPLSQRGEFYLLPLNAPWHGDTENVALSFVGYNYSYLEAAQGYLDRLETGRVGQCAAYVLQVMRHDGIDLGQRATPDAVVLAAQRRGASLLLVESDNG